MSALPAAATDFGSHVRDRLRTERVIWWTTVSRDGTPQPNPVWYVWDEDTDGGESIVVYNTPKAHRLDHIGDRSLVSLHFNATDHGNDVVVFSGVTERVEGHPGPESWKPYLTKYGSAMRDLLGTEEAFAREYGVPVRIRLRKTRGFV